ncbi:DnaJ domain-containing protein [Aerosakkonemataceae cyanobacterium BLCC-F154]|uniref:DnaJ domain-containing protein n=1 Tax=Floridaenema fluviatile BLCC-F154 TaxID=3153640 RepID=A0ABV4YBR8_9CYAN
MALNIEQGLFKFDCADHHAVLGVPLDATANEVRKRYLKISRRLHPDSCTADSEASKQQASQFFAKLVSPAYQQLFNDQSRAEHNVLLTRMGKRLVQEREKVDLQSELAQQLYKSTNLEHEYKTALHKLVEKQYESIDQILQNTAQISELNLVYLLRKSSQGQSVTKPPEVTKLTTPSVTTPAKTNPTAGKVPPPPPTGEKKAPKVENSAMEAYCRRAEEYIEKNYPAKAILELRDALKMEPKNSRIHALMAMAYLNQDQSKMAKIHLESALQFNPQEPTALEVKKRIDTIEKRTNLRAAAGKKAESKSGGGLFGLFGGKKK